MKLKLGTITVSKPFILEESAKVASIFAKIGFVPVSTQPSGLLGQDLMFVGISREFEEVPDGAPIQHYDLTIQTDDEGSVTKVTVSLSGNPTPPPPAPDLLDRGA